MYVGTSSSSASDTVALQYAGCPSCAFTTVSYMPVNGDGPYYVNATLPADPVLQSNNNASFRIVITAGSGLQVRCVCACVHVCLCLRVLHT